MADSSEIGRLSAVLGYPAAIEEMEKRIEKIINKETNLLLVCEDPEGEIAGWMQAHSRETIESGACVEIMGLVIAEDKRRRGVGRYLVQAAEKWATSLDIKSLVVRSNVLRKESHIFYPALGFEKNKTQAVYQKDLLPLGKIEN